MPSNSSTGDCYHVPVDIGIVGRRKWIIVEAETADEARRRMQTLIGLSAIGIGAAVVAALALTLAAIAYYGGR